MADEIGQVRGTIVIGSDLRGLDDAESAFHRVGKAGGELEGQLAELDLDLDLSSLQGAQAALENVSSAAAGLGDSLAGAGLEIDTSGLQSAAAALDDTAAAAAQMGAEAAGVGADVAELGQETDRSRDALGRFSGAAGKARVDTKSLGDEADRTGKGIGGLRAGLVAGAAALVGIGAGLGVAATKAAEYQQAVTLISTLSSDAAARFGEYKAGILAVSQALGQDAVAGAKAAYDALSSGVAADAAVGFLESASKAATAGVTSVDVAGKALTVTLNSYNLAASETTNVSDAMFAAANVGVTTFDELAASFGGVAGIAASSGASYQETLGALAQVTAGAAQERADAEEDAGCSATSAADETVSGFADVQEQSQETVSAVEGLVEALERLPKRIDIPLQVLGVDKAAKAIQDLARDLEAATGTWTLEIEGRYKGKGPMEPGGSLMLQHDVEDALAAAAGGLLIVGAYYGAGGAAWDGGGLALVGALGALQDQSGAGLLVSADVAMSEEFRQLLYDEDFESRFLQKALADLALLQAALDEASAAADRAAAVLPRAIQGITAALDAFFTSDPASGGLASLIAQFKTLGIELGDSFFFDAGILDVATFDELRAQLAALAGEPDRQEDLWKVFIDALQNKWKVYYEDQSNQLERQRRAIQGRIELAKEVGGEDADTSVLDAELEGVEKRLQAIKDQNDDVTNSLREQTFNVKAQFELYGRLADAAKDRAKVEADAARAVEQALKAAQDALRGRQRSSEDAEKSAHEQTMDLLEEELDRRERAHKLAMRRLDERSKTTEADIEAQIAAEDEAHRRRLAAITAEVDAADAVNDAEEARLKRAKLLVETVEAGNSLTSEQADFLRSLGIDPDRIAATNAALNTTKTQIDDVARSVDLLQGLLDKLPDEPGRVRIRGGELVTEAGRRIGEGGAPISQAERDALQQGLDSGEIKGRDRRIAEIALAGGVVQARRLREVLAPLIRDRETELETLQGQVDTAEKQVDLAGELLARREAALKVAQDEAAVARAALAGLVEAENKRFADFKTQQEARLDAIDETRRLLKDAYDAERQAIADAKDAEADRHRARMEQIQREYALELLRLGNTENEAQRILSEQAERAAKIAAEARRRFEEMLRQAGVTATPPEPGIGGELVPTPAAAGATLPGGVGVVPVPAPLLPPEPPPIEPPLPPPLPFAAAAATEAGEVLASFEDVFGRIVVAGDDAGRQLASGLVDPALREMATLMMQASELRSILTDIPILGGRIGDAIRSAPSAASGGSYEDNSRHFTVNGDIYIRPDDPAGDAILDSLGPRP